MVMVPQDAYSSLISQQQQLMPPVAMQLSNLDSEMKSILNNPNLSVDEKYNRYYRTFGRYGHLQERPLFPGMPDPLPPPAPTVVEKGTNTGIFPVSKHALLDTLPKVSRNKARILIDHLNSKKEIKWTDTGELLVGGYPVPGSNITDLVHFFTRNRPSVKPPPGAKELADQLQDTNVPMEAVAPESFNQVGTLNYDLGTIFSPLRASTSTMREPKAVRQKKKRKVEKTPPLSTNKPARQKVTPHRYADIQWKHF